LMEKVSPSLFCSDCSFVESIFKKPCQWQPSNYSLTCSLVLLLTLVPLCISSLASDMKQKTLVYTMRQCSLLAFSSSFFWHLKY
jgi:hypothetical protein